MTQQQLRKELKFELSMIRNTKTNDLMVVSDDELNEIVETVFEQLKDMIKFSNIKYINVYESNCDESKYYYETMYRMSIEFNNGYSMNYTKFAIISKHQVRNLLK